MVLERFHKSTDTQIHVQIPIRRHFVCSQGASPQLSHFACTLATDTGAHTHRRKANTVLQSFSCLFVARSRNISPGIAFTGIVLDTDRKFFVICKQNDEKMQCIKLGVSIRHACRVKHSNNECECTRVTHTYTCTCMLRNKIQHAADVNGYGYHIHICICIRTLAKPLYYLQLYKIETNSECQLPNKYNSFE